MPVPDYQSLMLPVLRIAAEGETRAIDIEKPIADQFNLTAQDRSQPQPRGGQRLLNNRIRWAKFFMEKAGLIVSLRRGWFTASEAGRVLLASNPTRIDLQRLLEYPSFREFYRRSRDGSGEARLDDEPAPDEQTEPPPNMHSTLQANLLERIRANRPEFLEGLILDLLVKMGYGDRNATTRLGRSGDGGVDGVINQDRLGLEQVYVQAKRYAPTTTVGRPDVQAFVGSLVGRGANRGVFFTTSSFSSQAIEYVRQIPQRVILIDGNQLADLMIEHNVGLRTVKQVDEAFFEE